MTDYAGAMYETCRALRDAAEAAGGDWTRAVPALAPYPWPLIDLDAEDEVFGAT